MHTSLENMVLIYKLTINCLHRLREISLSNKCKPVPHKQVVEQFSLAKDALSECRKFEKLIETDKWPKEMTICKDNILRTTRFDDEISSNRGNEKDILPSLVQTYRRLFSHCADIQLSKYIRALQTNSNGEQIIGLPATEKATLHTQSELSPTENSSIEKVDTEEGLKSNQITALNGVISDDYSTQDDPSCTDSFDSITAKAEDSGKQIREPVYRCFKGRPIPTQHGLESLQ